MLLGAPMPIQKRALLPIGFRDVLTPRWQRPIGSPVDPIMQVLDPTIKVCFVVVPCQPIHTRCSFSLEGEKGLPE